MVDGEENRAVMDKTKKSSGELRCKQSLILDQETKESWKFWKT